MLSFRCHTGMVVRAGVIRSSVNRLGKRFQCLVVLAALLVDSPKLQVGLDIAWMDVDCLYKMVNCLIQLSSLAE